MEFRDNIKKLRKEFFNVVKSHYDTSNLILKMISNKGIYKGLSDADLALRTCMLPSLSDKRINKLYDTNMEKAIENLRVRGVACLYAVESINGMMYSSIKFSNSYVEFSNQLKSIADRLKSLGKQSIELSNRLTKEHGHRLFNSNEFELDKDDFDKKISKDKIL